MQYALTTCSGIRSLVLNNALYCTAIMYFNISLYCTAIMYFNIALYCSMFCHYVL